MFLHDLDDEMYMQCVSNMQTHFMDDLLSCDTDMFVQDGVNEMFLYEMFYECM